MVSRRNLHQGDIRVTTRFVSPQRSFARNSSAYGHGRSVGNEVTNLRSPAVRLSAFARCRLTNSGAEASQQRDTMCALRRFTMRARHGGFVPQLTDH